MNVSKTYSFPTLRAASSFYDVVSNEQGIVAFRKGSWVRVGAEPHQHLLFDKTYKNVCRADAAQSAAELKERRKAVARERATHLESKRLFHLGPRGGIPQLKPRRHPNAKPRKYMPMGTRFSRRNSSPEAFAAREAKRRAPRWFVIPDALSLIPSLVKHKVPHGVTSLGNFEYDKVLTPGEWHDDPKGTDVRVFVTVYQLFRLRGALRRHLDASKPKVQRHEDYMPPYINGLDVRAALRRLEREGVKAEKLGNYACIRAYGDGRTQAKVKNRLYGTPVRYRKALQGA